MDSSGTSTQALSTRRRSRIWKRVVAGFLIIVAIYGLATIILGHMVSSKIAGIRASGGYVSCAELAGPRIPESENGALCMEQALKIIGSMPENMRKFETQSLSPEESAKNPGIWNEVGQELGHYSQVFALVEQAETKPKCRYTTNWSAGTNTQFFQYSRLRSLARLFAADARVKAYYGDTAGAVHSVELGIATGESLKNEPALISMLVRCSLIAITCRSAEGVADAPLDYAQAHRLYKALGMPNVADSLPQVMNGERAYIIAVYDQIRKDGLIPGLGGDMRDYSVMLKFRGTRTGRPLLYADELAYLKAMDEAIKHVGVPYREYNQLGIPVEPETPKITSLAQMLLPVYGRIRATVDSRESDLRGTQLYVALKAYKSRYGAYPQTLSQLRAKVTWGLNTEDPFSGKDYVYRPQGAGFLLYSIGNDLKDSGGIDWRDPKVAGTKNTGDMTWKTDR